MSEPKYDEDIVNLGYLNKVINNETSKSGQTISKHYASKPNTPYYAGDTWIDGNILYTCINTRLIGLYNDSDWVTESGAKQEAERKNKTFLTQPSNYNVGDMWILQSDTDHRAGKKGEILITTAGRKEYDADDWINMLDYGTIRSINEVANNINDALERLKLSKDNGIVTIFYSNTIPNEMIIGDLWFVIETIDTYTKNNLYKYDGTSWQIITDNLSVVAFEEANQARLVEDGKIQSFYDVEMPDTEMSVGDIWINTDNKKLYRYNGTNWVPVYDTRINEIRKSVESVSETMVEISTDLGQIKQTVANHTETITKLGSTEIAEGTELNIDASKNPAHIKIWGKTEQTTSTTGKNKLDQTLIEKKKSGNNFTIEQQTDKSIRCYGTASVTSQWTFELQNPIILKPGTYTFSPTIINNITANPSMSCRLLKSSNNTTNENSFGGTWAAISNNSFIPATITETTTFTHLFLYTNANYETDIVVNFQVESGNSKSTFEQFIPTMPSPNYPSRIRNIGDNINLAEYVEGLWFNSTSLKFLNIENTYGFVAKVKPNTQYIINKKYKGNRFLIVSASAYPQNNTDIVRSILTANNNLTQYTFTTQSNEKYIFLGVYVGTDEEELKKAIKEVKIEEGSTATPYTEYGCGSIDYAIEDTSNNIFNKYTDIELDGQYRAWNTGNIATNQYYYGVKVKVEENREYKVFSFQDYSNLCFFDKDMTYINGDKFGKSGKRIIFRTPSNCEYITLAVAKSGINEFNITEAKTIHSPLSKGQLLHERDYLAKDGIHPKRKTIILTGEETITLRVASQGNSCIFSVDGIWNNKDLSTRGNIICTHFKNEPIKWANIDECIFGGGQNEGNTMYFKILKSRLSEITSADCKAFVKQQYENNTPIIVEYQLAEEIITPLTPIQQEIIDNIETFKGTNYIRCINEIVPEKIELEYYPNTPFNDNLINKDTFDKVTNDMSAQINIKANEVETSVRESTTSSILTLLNNGYLTAEQVNALVNGNAEDIATVKEQLKQTVTSSQMQIEITKAIEGGVSYLKNTLFTIDDKGMAIATNQDEFNALYNNKGMYLYSFEQLIAKFDVDGATLNNLKVLGEVETENLRMANVSVSGVAHTHIHWIGV